MRYQILATALSLGLGTGVAIADEGQPSETDQPSQSDQATMPQSQQSSTQPQGMQQEKEKAKTTAAEEPNVQSVDLFFETDSALLKDSAKQDLWKLAGWARCTPHAAIILEGHADPRGTQDYNLKLSGERAAVVRAKLISMGVPSDRIVLTVYGENGAKRASFQQDRRVTARAVTRPIAAQDFAG